MFTTLENRKVLNCRILAANLKPFFYDVFILFLSFFLFIFCNCCVFCSLSWCLGVPCFLGILYCAWIIHGILRCFNTVFRRPCRCFSIALKMILSLSGLYKLFTSDWLRIEVCQNAVFSKLDITVTTTSKKLQNR